MQKGQVIAGLRKAARAPNATEQGLLQHLPEFQASMDGDKTAYARLMGVWRDLAPLNTPPPKSRAHANREGEVEVPVLMTARERKLADTHSKRVLDLLRQLPSVALLRERLWGNQRPLGHADAAAFLQKHRSDEAQASGWLEFREPGKWPDFVPVRPGSRLDALRLAAQDFARTAELMPWFGQNPAASYAWFVLTDEWPKIRALSVRRTRGRDVNVVTITAFGFVGPGTVARAYSRATSRRAGRPVADSTPALVAWIGLRREQGMSWSDIYAAMRRERRVGYRRFGDWRAMRRAFSRAVGRGRRGK